MFSGYKCFWFILGMRQPSRQQTRLGEPLSRAGVELGPAEAGAAADHPVQAEPGVREEGALEADRGAGTELEQPQAGGRREGQGHPGPEVAARGLLQEGQGSILWGELILQLYFYESDSKYSNLTNLNSQMISR